MKIFLDTKDLIDLAESNVSVKTKEKFITFLKKRSGCLVYSDSHVYEIMKYGDRSRVYRIANFMDELPHTWIGLVHLSRKEIEHGYQSFLKRAKYENIDPFVESYVETHLNPKPKVVSYYKDKQLYLTINHLYFSGKFIIPEREEFWRKELLRFVEVNRKILSQVSRKDTETKKLFFHKIISHLTKGKIQKYTDLLKDDDRVKFAKYIYNRPFWCPAFRLQYEIIHIFLRTQDPPKPSDLTDFAFVQVLPYVDAFTTDKQFANFITQFDKKAQNSLNYSKKVFKSIEEICERV